MITEEATHSYPLTTPAWKVAFDDGSVELVVAPTFESAADHAIEAQAARRGWTCDGAHMQVWWRGRVTKVERV